MYIIFICSRFLFCCTYLSLWETQTTCTILQIHHSYIYTYLYIAIIFCRLSTIFADATRPSVITWISTTTSARLYTSVRLSTSAWISACSTRVLVCSSRFCTFLPTPCTPVQPSGMVYMHACSVHSVTVLVPTLFYTLSREMWLW